MKQSYNCSGYLQLLPGCAVYEGVRRALIVNPVSTHFDIIPLAMSEVIDQASIQPLNEVYEAYGPDNEVVIDSYIELLTLKGYAVILDTADETLKASSNVFLEWNAPVSFTNAIIDFNSDLEDLYLASIKELGLLGCEMVQLRFLGVHDFAKVKQIVLNAYGQGTFQGLSIVASIERCGLEDACELEDFVRQCPIITEIILYNASKDDFYENKKYRFKVLMLKNEINRLSCGAVQPLYFAVNVSSYSESFSHNSCLNRKISIDFDGNIKNCPSLSESFGHIKNISLSESIAHPEFQKYWFVTKDQVSKCKGCEFRKVCTDCRAFVQNPGDLYAAPLKCGYNPDTCEWEEWSENPLKQKAILHYGLQMRSV